ncbi:hypothetical protein C5167_024419 [Papaver somniferum]|uniref:CRAL-TRIO domain-containing protein n=1 Tax=Papaver somniferum TaxID=3469 RepID=A0A4Y7JNJ0_PAPSO|nr:patellin-1-like [Papaver somniferum]RZC62664.1 hypothetical protein C5167_024419 [Papaver somniferum]
MAEETKPAAAAAPVPESEVVVVSETTAPEPVKVEETSSTKEEVVVVAAETESEKPKEGEEVKIDQSVSFKEESNIVADLEDPEKKALDEFKALIQEALNKHEFTKPPPPPKVEEKKAEVVEEKKAEEKTEEVTAEAETSAPKEPETTTEAVKEEEKTETTTTSETTPEAVKEEEKPEPSVVAEVAAKVVEEVAAVVEEVSDKKAIEESIVKSEPEPESSTTPDPATVVVESVVVETITEVPITEEEQVPPPPPEEVSIYGIPLLADERSDVILLKFLRARDFNVKQALTMLKNVVQWRKETKIEELLEEDLGNEFEKAVYMDGCDKEGHPVCYNVFGELSNKDLEKFLKWRIQFLEKSIRKLDYAPGGICTLVQVNDLKNARGPFQEIRAAIKHVALLQDNYPEFVAKQIFINVPWWYLAVNRMMSPFLSQRTKSKFVFAGPSKTTDTLCKYIAPERLAVAYGGAYKEGEHEFSTADSVTEITIKPATKQTVEFPATEASTLVWELRVVGWEVSYGAEFVPEAEDGYTVIVSKTRKLTPADEAVVCTSFKIGEPGKIILTIDNQTSKKKKLLYRSKTKSSSD